MKQNLKTELMAENIKIFIKGDCNTVQVGSHNRAENSKKIEDLNRQIYSYKKQLKYYSKRVVYLESILGFSNVFK